jgi:hypothetical protein
VKIDNYIKLDESSFQQFEYRLIYMRLSSHSDERLTVGLAAESTDGVEVKLISSVPALTLLESIVGEEGVEQLHFAVSELRRSAHKVGALSELLMPTDLLISGDAIAAFTQDRNGLLQSVLASASTLNRTSSSRAREVIQTTSSRRMTSDLYDQVSMLNPLKASDLFHRKVAFDSEKGLEEVDLPILGDLIFGAPVSFANATSDQKVRAEAYVAKFNWVRKHIPQKPKVYVLIPEKSTSAAARRAEGYIRELQAVAHASDVGVDVSNSMSELASILIRDEAA